MTGQDTLPEENFPAQTEWNAHEAARRLQIGRFFARALGTKGWTQTACRSSRLFSANGLFGVAW